MSKGDLKMKKTLLVFVAALVILTGCTSSKNIMKGYAGFTKTDHHFVAPGAESFVTSLENKEAGIYYIGFAECPWCKALVPLLEELATEYNTEIKYLNTKGNDFKDNQALIDRYSAVEATFVEDAQNKGTVPLVIAIDKSGNMTFHRGTAPTFKPGVNDTMTEQENEYVLLRVGEMFKAVTE